MKHLYVILWVINSFIGTGLLASELQEDENLFSSAKGDELFEPHFSGERSQIFYNALYDFDFEYFLSINEKSLQPPHIECIIKIYGFIYSLQTSIIPLLYDLPPPDSIV